MDGSAPGIGHNMDMTESEFLAFVKQASIIEAERAAANEKRKALRKQVKAKGMPLAVFDETFRRMTMTREENAEFFRQLDTAMRWARHPIGFQGDLFGASGGGGSLTDDEDDEARAAALLAGAGDAGYRAALLNQPSQDNPYDVTTDAGQKWLAGWHEGAAVKAAELEAPGPNDDGDVDDPDDDEADRAA